MVNAPTANTIAAAEHGIALITALSRNVAQADASVKAGKWERTKYVGVSIVGKVLAIMGFGKVGILTAANVVAAKHASMYACNDSHPPTCAFSSTLLLVAGDTASGSSSDCRHANVTAMPGSRAWQKVE